MFTVTKFPHGTFSWADLIATDQVTPREFYAKLMDWETSDVAMDGDQMYTFFTVDGHRVATAGPMPQEMRDQGIPTHWANYITFRCHCGPNRRRVHRARARNSRRMAGTRELRSRTGLAF